MKMNASPLNLRADGASLAHHREARVSDSVLLERDGAVATVTLNRPDRLNSFSTEMTTRLSAVLDEIEHDRACRATPAYRRRAWVLRGSGSLGESVAPGAAAPRVDVGQSIETRFNPLVRKMRAMPKPIVVAVNGVAAGAGASFALLGDITLAAKSARFIQSFVKIGLIPDCGGTWLFTHMLGEPRAKALAMLAEPVTAEQAAAWGLIWKAVDDADLMPEARKLAADLATQPTEALAAIRKAIYFASARLVGRGARP